MPTPILAVPPVLLVAFGGAVGAALRFAVGQAWQRWTEPALFPYATTTVNLLGCLAIGFLSGLVDSIASFDPTIRACLITGILGGFTTFSAFGYETVLLMQRGAYGMVFLAVATQVLGGCLCVFLGLKIAQMC